MNIDEEIDLISEVCDLKVLIGAIQISSQLSELPSGKLKIAAMEIFIDQVNTLCKKSEYLKLIIDQKINEGIKD